MTISISSAKWDKLKIRFPLAHPIPVDEDGNPIMQIGDWIKQCIIGYLCAAYEEGDKVLYNNDYIEPIREGIE